MKRFLACLYLLLGLSPSFAQFNGTSGIYALNGQTFGLTTTRLKIISGGTGYALGDTLTLTCPQIGAANLVPATVTVSSVSSGAITGVTVTAPGTYTALPSTGDSSAVNGVCSFAQASTSGSGSGAVISTLLAFNATGGTGGITNGSTPIIGATSGQYLYNNSGVVGFQALSGGGNVSSSGSPVAGNLALWSSAAAIGPLVPGANVVTALGLALNGSGAISATTSPAFVTPSWSGVASGGSLTLSTPLAVAQGGSGTTSPGLIAGTNITSITGTWPNQTINAAGGGGITAPGTTTLNNIAAWNSTTGAALLDTGIALASNKIGTSSTGLAGLYLQGSSSGTSQLFDGNSTATNRTITFPNTGNTTDIVAVLGAAQTFSGAITHSGSTLFSGAAATLSANTTTVLGGTAAPTWGAAGELAVGGNYTLGAVGNTNSGGVSLSAGNGLQLQGYGSSYDLVMANHSGTIIFGILSNGTAKIPGILQTATLQISATGHVYASATSPSITSGGTIGTTNGTFAFTFTATATSATTVVAMPAATTGWICPSPVDFTTPATSPLQTATTTNSVTITPYARNSTTAQATWANADLVGLVCFGY
jgi:hypothetical protein